MLCFRKFLVAKKFIKKKGEGDYRNFPSKIFCLEMPKKFVGESLSLSILSGIENIYASEGYITILRGNVFVSQYRNISSRNHSVLCFKKLLVAKKFMERKWGGLIIETFRRNFFVSQYRNFS